MKPYYADDFVTIYHADMRDVFPAVEFDAIVSDPPYGIGYAGYNHGKVAGDEDTAAVEWLLKRIPDDRPAVLTGANHFATLLPTVGTWSVWDKRTNESADRMFGAPFELIWSNGADKAGKMYRIQHGGVVNADGGGVKRVHATQKPLTLMLRLITDYGGDGIIIDPFAGSGSTGVACQEEGRRFMGCDRSAGFVEVGRGRNAI